MQVSCPMSQLPSHPCGRDLLCPERDPAEGNCELDLLDAVIELSRAGTCSKELFQTQMVFPACALEQSLLGPHSSGAKAEAPAQTGVGCPGPALLPWDWGHSRAGWGQGGKSGALHDPASHLCVCGGIARHKHRSGLFPCSPTLPSTGRGVGKAPDTQDSFPG